MSATWNKTTCPYCGIGCGLMVGVEAGAIIDIAGMKGHPVNNGDICALASNIPLMFSAEGRLTRPMIRRGNKLETTTWDDAITNVSSKFKNIINNYGPGAIAFYGGASNLTEDYYLINKLFKGFIGTNNVECSTRLCMSSTAAGFLSTIGADAPPTCYDDIEQADLFYIAGNNMAVSTPIIFHRVRDAKENNGAKIIVVDPRRTETAQIADIHLQIKPGTDVALNNALAHVLFRDGFVKKDGVEIYASGLCDINQFLLKYPPSAAAVITGCPEEKIVEAAHAIGHARAMLTFWFQGYNHSTQAVFKNNTLHNLSILTGNLCRPGAGPLSITGEANTLGNRWVGALSHLLPGMRQIANAAHRKETADYWGIPVENIQPTPGRSIIDIIQGLHSGDIRALWVCNTNPAASLPNTKWIEEGLSKAEILVVQDIFHPTETTMLADVILPAAQWSEKTGTFISSERRIELVEKFIEPPGEAKADYEIIWLIARAMGYEKEFPYTTSEEVFEEFKGLTSGRICDMAGITYERLRGKIGIQLPCPAIEHPGTPRLFTDMRFPRADGRAALLPREYIEPAETISPEYPIILITGRLSAHFNTRTRTGRVNRLNNLAPDNFVEINPEDAKDYNISGGEIIEITSLRGSVRGHALLTDKIIKGTIFIPSHYGKALTADEDKQVNLVTNQAYDIHSKQPEFKYSAVKITKLLWT
ncbi:MAG: nitrate reductase [Nitrospirae bacterium]|nr:nitrate reductase [Nitrospirota bacterium]